MGCYFSNETRVGLANASLGYKFRAQRGECLGDDCCRLLFVVLDCIMGRERWRFCLSIVYVGVREW